MRGTAGLTASQSAGSAADTLLPAQDPAQAADLGRPLTVLLRQWHADVDAVTSELPDGARGYQVLDAVVREDLPTQTRLAARLGIDRTVMTYLIDRYVDCGLMERRIDPADRRVRRIVATDKGRSVHRELSARVAAVEEALLGDVAARDRVTVSAALARAADACLKRAAGRQSVPETVGGVPEQNGG